MTLAVRQFQQSLLTKSPDDVWPVGGEETKDVLIRAVLIFNRKTQKTFNTHSISRQQECLPQVDKMTMLHRFHVEIPHLIQAISREFPGQTCLFDQIL